MQKKVLLVFLLLVNSSAFAEVTKAGKVLSTQGHEAPNCRIVKHKENDVDGVVGITRFFRIKDVVTDDDVSAVALAALVSNRDVTINYVPGVGSGCGSEPKILYITIY